MKTTKSNINKDDVLVRASFELFNMKVKETESELSKIEVERNDIIQSITNSETGIASDIERSRLDELSEREATLHEKWNDLELSYQVGSLSESIQQEDQQPTNEIEDQWFEDSKSEYTESEIEETMDELNEIRDAQLSQEHELDMPDF